MTLHIRIPLSFLVCAATGLVLASGCARPRTPAAGPPAAVPPAAPAVERVTRLQASGLRLEVRIGGASTMRIGEREPVVLGNPPPHLHEAISAATGATPGVDPSIPALSGELMAIWAALGRVGSALADAVEAESRAGRNGQAAKIAQAWLESGTLRLAGTRSDGQKASFDVKLDPATAERLRSALSSAK